MEGLARSVEHGCSFLSERQHDDGTWRDFLTLAGEAVDWTTAYAAYQLGPIRTVSADAHGRAVAALRARQRDDGGWGFHRHVPTDADTSAFALAVLATVADVPRPKIDEAVECLLTHQCANGGFATYRHPSDIGRFLRLPAHVSLRGWCQPCAEITAVAGIALLRSGVGDVERAKSAWSYLVATQHEDGSWPTYWWSSAHYATSLAIVLGIELRARHVDPGPTLERATRWAVRAAGVHASAFALGSVVSALAHAAPRSHELDEAASELARRQCADGGWQAEPILRIPWPARAKHDEKVRWGVDRLGVDVIVRDHNASFTTATCVGALALASEML